MAKKTHFMYNKQMSAEVPPQEGSERYVQKFHLEIILTRQAVLDEAWDFELCSPFWRLYVNEKRGAHIVTSGRRHELRPGHLYLIPAWLAFTTGTDSSTTQSYVHFDVTGLSVNALRRSFSQVLTMPLSGLLSTLSTHWKRSLHREGECLQSCGRAYSLIYEAMGQALLALGPDDPIFKRTADYDCFQPALACIEQQTAHPPANAELARLCNLSKGHFITRFQTVFGTTPAQYGLDHRLKRGANLLTRSTRTISDISELLGFADRFHFSKAFKSNMGVAPAAYRRMHQSAT